MAIDLTQEAAEGYDYKRDPSTAGCPYLYSSPASMAWYLGCHLAAKGFPRPGHHDGEQFVLSSRGNTFRLCVHGKGPEFETRFRWNDNNTITELA